MKRKKLEDQQALAIMEQWEDAEHTFLSLMHRRRVLHDKFWERVKEVMKLKDDEVYEYDQKDKTVRSRGEE